MRSKFLTGLKSRGATCPKAAGSEAACPERPLIRGSHFEKRKKRKKAADLLADC